MEEKNMIGELEENAYFRNIVSDAVKEIKKNGYAYVFYEEQINAVKNIMGCELNIECDDTIYRLSLANDKNDNT